ncbi:MAG TPA: response regulator [Geobacteraceae bacterium]|nr:response regulator [Geobacteraceae bacterium]
MFSPLRSANKTAILYVEDDEISRKSLGLIIKRRYPEVPLFWAANGKEGLDMFMLEKPALVITDIIMPVMDGIEMIQKIREINPDTCIIVTSASCDVVSFTHRVELDSRFYLCKPIDISKLFAAIDECLAVQDMAKEEGCSALAG